MSQHCTAFFYASVLPLTREWIEIYLWYTYPPPSLVLPLTREWIEIYSVVSIVLAFSVFSLSRGSGLKYPNYANVDWSGNVLPLTREWIEIRYRRRNARTWKVLPLTREWIEIYTVYVLPSAQLVLPLTREWIEIFLVIVISVLGFVLPLTREWIEITGIPAFCKANMFSLSRGSGLKYSRRDDFL